MFGYLLLLFVLLPFAELALLLALADKFSWQATLALVVFTGILGASLARWQGFRTFVRIQDELAQSKMPRDSLMDAGMILVAAAFLVTPGIITDLFGFSLLLPPCRRLYRSLLARWLKGKFQIQTHGSFTARENAATEDRIIDVKVVESSEDNQSP